MLLQLSQFFPFAPLHIAPPTPSDNPQPFFMSMGHTYKFLRQLHFLYGTLYPHGFSVTTYLYFLITFISFSCLIDLASTSGIILNRVVRLGILALFLTLAENLSAFHHEIC